MLNRKRSQSELLEEAEDMGKDLLAEAKAIRDALQSLTSRLDRLIMILAVIGGVNSLLGNGLLEALNQGRKSQAEPQQIGSPGVAHQKSLDWVSGYWERLD